MAIKIVIFDLDGTITEPFIDFDRIRADIGLRPDDGPIWEAMSKMTDEQRSGAEQILNRHEAEAIEKSSLNTHARETLDTLKQMNIGVGILTRNLKENALAVAKKHNLKFDIVVGRKDGPVKPDAFGVLQICRYFSVEADEALVVGDYLFDLLCARAAGAIPVLLANHAQADEFAMYADFTIETIDQILQIIEEINTQ